MCGLAGEGGLKPNIHLDNEIEKERIKQQKARNTSALTRIQMLDRWNSQNNVSQEEKDAKLIKHDLSLNRALNKCEERIGNLEQAKDLRLQLLLDRELVSDDYRRYGRENSFGVSHTIETHCTILRAANSHRNTYFGHVSLYSRTYLNGIADPERVWHYGVHIVDGGIEPLNPQHPIRSFWPASAPFTLISDLCRSSPEYLAPNVCPADCEAVAGFPANTYVSNLLMEHFIACQVAFSTAQWRDQEWGFVN
jgi:hypothetical protein